VVKNKGGQPKLTRRASGKSRRDVHGHMVLRVVSDKNCDLLIKERGFLE